VAVVGLVPDVTQRCEAWFRDAGDQIAILGETKGQLGGSEYLAAFHQKTAGLPPRLDAAKEKALQQLVRELVRNGALKCAHDPSDGGLAVAIAESCMMNPDRRIGARLELKLNGIAAHAFLFGEDASRIVISFSKEKRAEIEAAAKAKGVALHLAGEVGGDTLELQGLLRVPVDALNKAYRSGIPSVLKRAVNAPHPGQKPSAI
jgi:phosphoribosylformylglycinamidine (FGAM) synthase-like enzyme